MFEFRPTYEPLVKLCKELIAEKKVLMEENEGLKETLRCLRQDNEALRAKLFSKPNDDKLVYLEKRVADLEEQLEKNIFLLDDEGTPIKSFTLTGKPVLMDEPEPTEEKLEVGKWYDARTFEVEKLKKLLPVGTLVTLLTEWDVDEERNLTNIDSYNTAVSPITSVESEIDEHDREETVIYVDRYKVVPNNWFKLSEDI